MTQATWNQKFETLLVAKTQENWLGHAKVVLAGIKPRSRLSPFLYVGCMAHYLRIAASAEPTPDVMLPVQRFIEYLAAQPERVLFDNPRVYPDASGMYLIKKLPIFFKDIDNSKEQSALFARAVTAADHASVVLLERLLHNCGLLQQQSTEGFLKNTETYYSVFLRLCRDGLMDHGWKPVKRESLHPVWDLYHFNGVSGTPTEQRAEEHAMAKLATILPASFETIVSFPYANAKNGNEFTANMLAIMASMDMTDCHSFTRSQLMGNWCNEQNAGWAVVKQRYPDYALAVDMHRGLLGNMAHYNNMDLMASLWQTYAIVQQQPALSLTLPHDFADAPLLP